MRTRIQSLLLTLLLASFAAAEVPSLINYQGRITGPGGAPATGTRNFELKIYDAQAGGNLLYSEDMGAITLGEGGVYGFRFGASGTSVATRSETLATTDGTLTVFNGTLSATAIPGSVSLSDGTFTWSQSAGSSAPANFIGSFVAANGTASAIYIQGAPAAGTAIEVSFNYEEAGITGALSNGSSHWLELTVDGTVQATRERVLAVPFASVARRARGADTADNIAGFDLEGIRSMVYDLYERTGAVAGRNYGNAYTIGNADFRPSDWNSSISTPVYDIAWTGGGPRNVSFQIVTNATNAFINSLSVPPTFRYSSQTRPWWVRVDYSNGAQLEIVANQLPVDPDAPARRLWQNPTPDLLVRSMVVETRNSATGFDMSFESVTQTVPGKTLDWNFSLPDRFEQRLRLRTSWSGNWDWELYQTTEDGEQLVFESSQFDDGIVDAHFERINGSNFSLRVVQDDQRSEKTLSFGALHFYQE